MLTGVALTAGFMAFRTWPQAAGGGGGGKNAHPGGDYYVWPPTGTIQAQANPLLAMGLRLSGWLGPFHWDQAQAELKNTGH